MTPTARALRFAPVALMALLGACATSQPSASAAAATVAVPDSLRVPAGQTLARTLVGSGVQIYQCRAKAADANASEWVLVAPEAQLFDAGGVHVGKHYGGPTWESDDGSKIVGSVQAKLDAPDAGSIQWLLLSTHSTGGAGAFANVTSVQRLATSGGVAPATGCGVATIGQTVRVPYKAQYVQYVTKG